MYKKLLILGAICSLISCSQPQEGTLKTDPKSLQNEEGGIADSAKPQLWPRIASALAVDEALEAKIDALLTKMTLEQKVAQMIQPEIRDISVDDMRKYGFGSYLNGGGAFPNNNKHSTPADWIALAEQMYQASIDDSLDGSTIPTMWGTDAVHGHNNVIGATLFPHNIGLGAMNNPELLEKIAQITATEVMVTGIDWVFAPTVATVRDDRWGRTYEGYSEDPEIVKAYASAIVRGLQGVPGNDFLGNNRVISTVKHFVGDGGTEGGDDQGNNIDSEQDLYRIHAQGYVGGLNAGAQTVMASFNSWHGNKIHGSHYLLTEVLKQRMGFDGFVVGDWNGHGQVKGCSNESCPQAINAGLDVFMAPTRSWKALFDNTIAQVRSGEIPQTRIDDAVRRILRVKLRAGLFDKPSPAQRMYSGRTELIGHETHREVARQAVRESLVLLKNKNNLLPLAPAQKILVAGDGAHNLGKQSGGWSITWQGTGNRNEDFPGGTSIYQGLERQVLEAGGQIELSPDGSFSTNPDVAIVVFGEDPYAEGHGDRENMEFQRGDKKALALLKKFQAQNIPVVSLFISGRPMWVNAELNASNAFVAIWLPGTEGEGVADVLLADATGKPKHDFKGKLAYSWPRHADQTAVNVGDTDYDPLLPYGFGLTYGDDNLLADDLNETLELDEGALRSKPIYQGAIKKPWTLHLLAGEQQLEVSANAHSLAGLSFRTIDRNVQEDAFKLNWSGDSKAQFRVLSQGGFREDLRSLLEQDAALQFSLKLEQEVSSSLLLSMRCSDDSEPDNACGHGIDISQYLQPLAQSQWHEFSVDLACFKQGGMRFADTIVPFEMTSQAPLTISLSEIEMRPKDKQHMSVRCD